MHYNYSKKRHSYRCILVMFCIGLMLTLMISENVTVMASSDGSGWISDDAWNSVYGTESDEGDKNDEDAKEAEVGSIERLFAGLFASLGYGINHILELLGFDIDSIVLGRVATGKDVNFFGFELQRGNPYGVVGANAYSILRSLAYAFLGIELLYLIVVSIFSGGNAQRRNEFKSRVSGIALSFIALRGMPYVLNICIFVRDSFLKELNSTNGSVSIFDVFYGVFDKTSSSYDKNSQTLIMGLLCIGASAIGLWFAYCYIGIALSVLVHFFLFPAVLCFGESTKQRVSGWVGEVTSSLSTPLIDTVLLGVVGYIATLSSNVWQDKIQISIVQLLVAASVIPVRELCKRILGFRDGGESIGLKGLGSAFLMMSAARSMARHHSDRVAKNKEARELQSSADAENELADIEEQEIQDKLNNFNDKYGSNDAIRDDISDNISSDNLGEDEIQNDMDNDAIQDNEDVDGFGDQVISEDETIEESGELVNNDYDAEDNFDSNNVDISSDDGKVSNSDISDDIEETATNAQGIEGNKNVSGSKSARNISDTADIQSTLEDRMKRQQEENNDLENQKNEINSAMADENAKHNERMGELSSEEQQLQKSSADARAQIAMCDEQIADKAAEEAGMRAKIAENKEKIDAAKSNNDLDTMQKLQKENLSLETKAAKSKADQMAIKAGPEYTAAKNTLAQNEQQIRALNNQSVNEKNRHAAAMDSYNKQLTDTNAAISVGRQHMEQMRNDIKGMGGTIGGYGTGAQSRVSSVLPDATYRQPESSANNVVSFDEMRQQVYQKRANIDNFQKPEYLNNLSHRQKAELYEQKSKALRREVRSERIGSALGGAIGVGASMFFGAQGKTLLVSGGSALGGGIGRNMTPENIGRTAARVTQDASSIARSIYKKGQTAKENVSANGVAGSVKNAVNTVGADLGRKVGKAATNIRRWSDENWDGNWQEPVGVDNTYHPVTFEEIPLPTNGSVQGVNAPQNTYAQISPQQYAPVPPVESEAAYNPFTDYQFETSQADNVNDVTRVNYSETLQELVSEHSQMEQQLENLKHMQSEQFAKFSQEEVGRLQQLQQMSVEEMTEQDVEDFKNILLKR